MLLRLKRATSAFSKTKFFSGVCVFLSLNLHLHSIFSCSFDFSLNHSPPISFSRSCLILFRSSLRVARIKLGPKALQRLPASVTSAASTETSVQHRVWEKVVAANETIEGLQAVALSTVGLFSEGYHLRTSNWCGEVGDPLSDPKQTIQSAGLTHNATIFVEEGAVQSKVSEC